jgi:hypothetical protein
MKSMVELGERDLLQRGFDFARAVKYYAHAKGRMQDALAYAELTRKPDDRVVALLRAAVGAGSTSLGSPSPWGDELVGYRALQDGFYESLRSRSAFFRLLGDGSFSRVPMQTRVGISTTNATGWIVGAGKPVPLTRLNIAPGAMDPIKAASLMVVTEELLEAAGPAAEALFGRELRGAVADVVDREFFSIIGQGITPQTATANPLTDLQTLLDLVNATSGGRLYWLMSPKTANIVATQLTAGNALMFPNMTPTGGTLVGLPVVVSTQLPAAAGSPVTNSLWLIDGTGIAADAEGVEVEMSRESTVQMEDAPTQDAVAGTGSTVVSLWQTNSVGLLAKVYFAALRLRTNAVAVLEGIAW